MVLSLHYGTDWHGTTPQFSNCGRARRAGCRHTVVAARPAAAEPFVPGELSIDHTRHRTKLQGTTGTANAHCWVGWARLAWILAR